MTWQTATGLFVAFLVVLAIVWDITAYLLGGNEATISRICLETANKNRGFAFLLGVAIGLLAGHLLLPQRVK